MDAAAVPTPEDFDEWANDPSVGEEVRAKRAAAKEDMQGFLGFLGAKRQRVGTTADRQPAAQPAAAAAPRG